MCPAQRYCTGLVACDNEYEKNTIANFFWLGCTWVALGLWGCFQRKAKEFWAGCLDFKIQRSCTVPNSCSIAKLQMQYCKIVLTMFINWLLKLY